MANPYKKVPERSWPNIRDIWLGYVPDISQSASQSAPTVEALLASHKFQHSDFVAEDELPGVRRAVFSEAITLLQKGTYCESVAVELNRSGFPTWSAVMMYDACFFCARGCCSLLGVSYVGSQSKLYFDAFYHRVVSRKRTDIGFLFFDLPARFEHSVLWGILDRISHVTTGEASLVSLLQRVQAADVPTLSGERNRLIYQPTSWSMEEDAKQSDLSYRVGYVGNGAFLLGDTRPEFPRAYYLRYFETYQALHDLSLELLGDLATLSTAAKAYLLNIGPRPKMARSFV